MALCDELEAAQAKRERRRDRLVAATLHGLNNGDAELRNRRPSAPSKRAPASIFNHLPRLTTRPEHIQQLRQTILNLAVRGKLVPQDHSEESAEVLLNRFESEKESLVGNGIIRKQNQLPPIDSNQVPFSIPNNWRWVRLGNYFKVVTDGVHATPQYTESGVPFLSVNNIQKNRLTFHNCKYISRNLHKELIRRCNPEVGDILLGKVGSLGVCDYIRENAPEFSIFVQLALLKSWPETSPAFSRYLLLSPFVQQTIRDQAAGTALKYIGVGKISNVPVPIPPVAEQNRIVAKVDELMAMCDEVEARLTTMATTRRQLLEATLSEAIGS